MTEKITPAIFDKKKDAENSSDEPMIVHRKVWTDDQGVLHDEFSEPVPVSEWAAYEKENGL